MSFKVLTLSRSWGYFGGLGMEKFDNPCHRHWGAPLPVSEGGPLRQGEDFLIQAIFRSTISAGVLARHSRFLPSMLAFTQTYAEANDMQGIN